MPLYAVYPFILFSPNIYTGDQSVSFLLHLQPSECIDLLIL